VSDDPGPGHHNVANPLRPGALAKPDKAGEFLLVRGYCPARFRPPAICGCFFFCHWAIRCPNQKAVKFKETIFLNRWEMQGRKLAIIFAAPRRPCSRVPSIVEFDGLNGWSAVAS